MNIPTFLRSLLFLLLLHAGVAAKDYRINGRTVSLLPDPKSVLRAWSPRSDTLNILLHAGSFSNPAARQQLAASGILLRDYLGDSVFTALLLPSALTIPSVFDGIALQQPEWKIDAQLLPPSSGRVRAMVSCDADLPRSTIIAWLSRHGGTLHPQKWEQEHLYEIDLPGSALIPAAAWYGVQWIQPTFSIQPLDLDSKGSLAAPTVSAPTAFGGYGLLGSDVFIGHGDNCSGVYHADQQDRVINHNYGGKTSHGVLVNGLIGGQGFMDPAGMGIARKSSFVSFFYDEVILMKKAIYSAYNVSLTNNSYRADRKDLCGYSGVYDALSANLDKLAQSNPAQLDVFAASNDGTAVCNPYPAGYYTISGGFQTAKNVLVVGSCSRELEIANSSSRGPLKDGRLKPEVVAPGHNIYCPVPDNTYTYEYGTSLACPQVVGILSLLTERYRQIRSATPPGALLKALAINGATDMGRPGPDYWYGFGLVNARRSLAMIDEYRVFEEVMDNPSRNYHFSIPVPPGTAQLKVLLYYNDTAASPASGKQLVNDLDLRVTDPAARAHYPLVLDPSPDKVEALAKEGVDRLNNVEQVVITNPSAGNYRVDVDAHELPVPGQRFYVVFDFVPNELKILSPAPLEALKDSTEVNMYWNSSDTSTPIRIEFSEDGLVWTEMATVPGNKRVFKWTPKGVYSGECRMRATQGSLSDVSGPFVINRQPIVSLAPDQCPGSVSLTWTDVRGATNYVILQKKGPEFRPIDTVTATVRSYSVYGLNLDSDYYFSVQPLLSLRNGYRANALAVRPNKGKCATTPPGDLAIEGVEPTVGRRFTSTALSSATWLKAHIRNLDIVPHNFRIRYNLNNSGWRVLDGFSIAAGATDIVQVDTVDLSAVGSYSLVMTVQDKDILDPVKKNDTFRTTLRNLANDTIFLDEPLMEDFENFPNAVYTSGQLAFDLTERWDYANNSRVARFSTRAPVSVFQGSLGSVSLDAAINQKGVVNYFTGTLNLSAYDTSIDEVRFDYDYVLRGIPLSVDSNRVWVRGSDQLPWIPMTAYKANEGIQRAGTLSLRDLFRRYKQNFSGSVQVLFVQSDTSVIAGDASGTGLSIDNFRLFKVQKDVQMARLRTPFPEECSGASAPVRIQLRNGVPTLASGITLNYKLNDQPVVTELLSSVIAADDSLEYEFRKWLPDLPEGSHHLIVWLSMPGDEYAENDTLRLQFHISGSVNQYPLLEQFEDADALWYVAGVNPSWELGIPTQAPIDTAASGKRCWKTNLNGSYNASERSYLVSPCLNTASMNHPMLSFSMSFDMEDCFPDRCDYLTLQYSTDQGQTWNLLGQRTQGTNWYNKYGDYWSGSFLRWHVASIDLPKASVLKLRFAFVSDRGTNNSGVAIDDIHIYDRQLITGSPGVANQLQSDRQLSGSDGWVMRYRDSFVIASVLSATAPLTSATVYSQQNVFDDVRQQYTAGRSWNLAADSSYFVSGLMRLYLEDSALTNFWTSTDCATCTRASDIYRMGITHFDGAYNDSALKNNDSALATFLRASEIRWIPYDKGYYAEFSAIPRGEFWLNDGGITGTLPLNKPYVLFDAQRYGRYSSMLDWYSLIDADMDRYVLQRSYDSLNFTTFDTRGASGQSRYTQEDQVFLPYGSSMYYRVLGESKAGRSFYTPVRRVDWQRPEGVMDVYPVPSSDGMLRIRWNAAAGTQMPLRIFDMAGRCVYNETLQAGAWMNVQIVDLKHLMKGTYLLQLDWMEQPVRYTIQLL